MQISRRSVLSGSAALATAATLSSSVASAVEPDLAALLNSPAVEAISGYACPGVQLAVARDGHVLFSRGYGSANLETGTTVTEASVFRIGSLTKQFTAACIVKLAAEGKLQLEAPAARYLPFMSQLKPVSLFELLHHTAGLHDDDTDAGNRAASKGPTSQIALAETVARQSKPFDFEPGTAWLYSNANYIVLGAVIEAVTGMPFSEAMASIVFRPLGLSATAVDRSEEVVPRRVSGYAASNSGARYENAPYIAIAEAGGAGAMRSTAFDLCRWHTLLLSNRLFGERYVKLMLTPGRLRDGRLSGANRFSPQDVSYGNVQYACGLLVSAASDPHPSILHYGAIDGFASVLQTFLNENVTFAVLCNGDMGPAMPFRAIRKAVTETLLTAGK